MKHIRLQRTASFSIYYEKSPEYRVVAFIAHFVAPCLFIMTLIIAMGAIYLAAEDAANVIFARYWIGGLAFAWTVGAPMWFAYEYFFLFRRAGRPDAFEHFRHGQQAAMAIWLGLSVSLGTLVTSDLFDKPVAAVVECSSPAQSKAVKRD